jgi:hypothetical protein
LTGADKLGALFRLQSKKKARPLKSPKKHCCPAALNRTPSASNAFAPALRNLTKAVSTRSR